MEGPTKAKARYWTIKVPAHGTESYLLF